MHKIYCLNPFYPKSISSYTYPCALYKTKQQKEIIKGADWCLSVEKNSWDLSGVFGHLYKKTGMIVISYVDANIWLTWTIIQASLYGG